MGEDADPPPVPVRSGRTVAVCTDGGGVDLTDTSDPDGPVVHFSKEEWKAFVAGVRAGEFDFD